MITVFYKENQNVNNNKSYSPSAGKPKKVYDLFKNNSHVSINSDWKPITRQQFYISHDKKYVDGVLDCTIPNGFGNCIREVSDSLPYTSGSFYNAAVHALNNKVAMSPTSGFHHARYYNGGAFCTFNGLTITAQLLKHNHKINRIGIIDFDAHWGDGTEDIITKLKIKDITHLSHHKIFGYRDSNGIPLQNLYKTLDAAKDCEILLYQAGADPHVDDPLGGDLTTEQMLERDRIVFKFAKNNNIPIVWNLAGGYQIDFSKVLEIHGNTLKACIEVYE